MESETWALEDSSRCGEAQEANSNTVNTVRYTFITFSRQFKVSPADSAEWVKQLTIAIILFFLNYTLPSNYRWLIIATLGCDRNIRRKVYELHHR